MRLTVAIATVVLILIFGQGFLSNSGIPQAKPSKKPTPTAFKNDASTTLSIPVDYGHAYGIAAGSSLPGLTDSQLAARLDGMKAAGASWIRFDFDWSQIQRSNSRSYDWSASDRIVKFASARKLHILGIIDYTPSWARPASCNDDNKCAPANPTQYAAFATAAATRYSKQDLHTWEVWNEPNNPNFWQPSASPVKYTALLRAAYRALHTADKQAWVLTGGLSPQATEGPAYSPYDFISGMYASGAQGYFDAVADHPYTFPLTPISNENHAWAQMAATSHSLRSLMIGAGDSSKKIWITEFGSPTGGPGTVATLDNPNLDAKPYVVDNALQAKILSDAASLYHSYPWTGPFLYYSYQDAGTDPASNENFFGLVKADGAHKPAYDVFRQAAKNP